MRNDEIIKLKFISDLEMMNLEMVDAEELKLKLGEFIDTGGTKDYRKLINKPTINGTELVENYDEIDPTVPDWAKADKKPNYTSDEVGAVNRNDEMALQTIYNIWNQYFK